MIFIFWEDFEKRYNIITGNSSTNTTNPRLFHPAGDREHHQIHSVANRFLGQNSCNPCKPCTEKSKGISLQIYFLCVRKKSNREGNAGPGAIRFRFGAIKFAAKALRFPFVGPRLQRDHRRNLREGFAFHLGVISFDFDGLSINFGAISWPLRGTQTRVIDS